MAAVTYMMEEKMPPHYDEGVFGERGFTDADRDKITRLDVKMDQVIETLKDFGSRLSLVERQKVEKIELIDIMRKLEDQDRAHGKRMDELEVKHDERIAKVERAILLASGAAMALGSAGGFILKTFWK